MADYSYADSSPYRSCRNCECRQEIVLLQKKLTEVHSKLIAQMDACAQQEAEILRLHQLVSLDPHHYDTFGRNNKENMGMSSNKEEPWKQEDTREAVQIKNELLQADLEAMRHRVLTEITEKNRLLEEMGDLKKKHRKELSQELKKFQGLEILYRQIASQKGLPSVLPVPQALELERLREENKSIDMALQAEREKSRRLVIKNEQLSKSIEELTQQNIQLRDQAECSLRQQPRNNTHTPLYSEKSAEQLRQMEGLKHQISSINRNISLREMQFNRSRERRRAEEDKRRGEDCERELERKLVGESRWGKGLIS